MREYLKKVLVSAFLVSAASPGLAFAQGSPYDWRDWGPWHMWGGWGFGWFFPLFMMVFVALCVFFMSRTLWGHGNSHGDHTGSALQILNERFARGEISKEEYENRRSVLVRRT
jgi:putative membrane protein